MHSLQAFFILVCRNFQNFVPTLRQCLPGDTCMNECKCLAAITSWNCLCSLPVHLHKERERLGGCLRCIRFSTASCCATLAACRSLSGQTTLPIYCRCSTLLARDLPGSPAKAAFRVACTVETCHLASKQLLFESPRRASINPLMNSKAVFEVRKVFKHAAIRAG